MKNQINLLARKDVEAKEDTQFNVYVDATPEGFAELKAMVPEIIEKHPDRVSLFNNDNGFLRKFPGTSETLLQILEPSAESLLALITSVEESFKEAEAKITA